MTLSPFQMLVSSPAGLVSVVQTFSIKTQWSLQSQSARSALIFTPKIICFIFFSFCWKPAGFSLSQKVIFFFSYLSGGHPHNWNTVSKECLALLADLTQRLVAYHETVATNGRAKSLSSGSERKSSSETSGNSSYMCFIRINFQNNNVFIFSTDI